MSSDCDDCIDCVIWLLVTNRNEIRVHDGTNRVSIAMLKLCDGRIRTKIINQSQIDRLAVLIQLIAMLNNRSDTLGLHGRMLLLLCSSLLIMRLSSTSDLSHSMGSSLILPNAGTSA